MRCRAAFGSPAFEAFCEEAFAALDQDGSGAVDAEEFSRAVLPVAAGARRILGAALPTPSLEDVRELSGEFRRLAAPLFEHSGGSLTAAAFPVAARMVLALQALRALSLGLLRPPAAWELYMDKLGVPDGAPARLRAAAKLRTRAFGDAVRQAFEKLDADGNGRLARAELERFVMPVVERTRALVGAPSLPLPSRDEAGAMRTFFETATARHHSGGNAGIDGGDLKEAHFAELTKLVVARQVAAALRSGALPPPAAWVRRLDAMDVADDHWCRARLSAVFKSRAFSAAVGEALERVAREHRGAASGGDDGASVSATLRHTSPAQWLGPVRQRVGPLLFKGGAVPGVEAPLAAAVALDARAARRVAGAAAAAGAGLAAEGFAEYAKCLSAALVADSLDSPGLVAAPEPWEAAADARGDASDDPARARAAAIFLSAPFRALCSSLKAELSAERGGDALYGSDLASAAPRVAARFAEAFVPLEAMPPMAPDDARALAAAISGAFADRDGPLDERSLVACVRLVAARVVRDALEVGAIPRLAAWERHLDADVQLADDSPVRAAVRHATGRARFAAEMAAAFGALDARGRGVLARGEAAAWVAPVCARAAPLLSLAPGAERSVMGLPPADARAAAAAAAALAPAAAPQPAPPGGSSGGEPSPSGADWVDGAGFEAAARVIVARQALAAHELGLLEAPEPWSLLLDRLRVPVEGAARAAAARAVAGAGFDQLAGAIFDSLDADGSGALSRGELGRLAVAAAARSEGMLGVAVDASVGDIRALAAAYDAAREAAGLAAGAELTRRDAAAAVKMAVALLAVKASASGTLAAAASAGAVAEDAQSVAI